MSYSFPAHSAEIYGLTKFCNNGVSAGNRVFAETADQNGQVMGRDHRFGTHRAFKQLLAERVRRRMKIEKRDPKVPLL